MMPGNSSYVNPNLPCDNKRKAAKKCITKRKEGEIGLQSSIKEIAAITNVPIQIQTKSGVGV